MGKLEGSERITWLCIYVPSSLSLAAAVWMLTSYVMFPKLQTPTIRLIMLKTIVQVMYSLVYNVAFYNVPPSNTAACELQGWGIVFCGLCSVFLTAAMAGYMVLTIEKKQRIVLTNTRLAVLSTVIATLAAILSSIPLLFDQYANLGARCWIAEDEDGRNRQTGNILRFTVYYGIIWFCIAFVLVAFFKVARYLRQTSTFRTDMALYAGGGDDAANQKFEAMKSHATFVHRTVSVLLMYPVISICAWAPNTILRAINAINPSYEASNVFVGFCMVAASAQGIFYGLVFWTYRAVHSEWKLFFRKLQTTLARSLFAMTGSSVGLINTVAESSLDPLHAENAANLALKGGGRAPDGAGTCTDQQDATQGYMTHAFSTHNDDGSEESGDSYSIDGVNPITAPGASTHHKKHVGASAGTVASGDSNGSKENDMQVLLIPTPKSSSSDTNNTNNIKTTAITKPAMKQGFSRSFRSSSSGGGGGSNFWPLRNRISDTVSRFSTIIDLDMELPEDEEADESQGIVSWEAGTRNVRILSRDNTSFRRGSSNHNVDKFSFASASSGRQSSFATDSSHENNSSIGDQGGLELRDVSNV